MNNHKSLAKPERSYLLVIVLAFLIAVLTPFVRAVATGDMEVAAAYASAGPVVPGHGSLARGGADELSLLVVGAFLLGVGSVLRRVA